jgi:hypothetical protein
VVSLLRHHINTNFATDVKADRKHGKRSPPTN